MEDGELMPHFPVSLSQQMLRKGQCSLDLIALSIVVGAN